MLLTFRRGYVALSEGWRVCSCVTLLTFCNYRSERNGIIQCIEFSYKCLPLLRNRDPFVRNIFERLHTPILECLRLGMMLRRPINENKLPAEITWTFKLVGMLNTTYMLVRERLLC